MQEEQEFNFKEIPPFLASVAMCVCIILTTLRNVEMLEYS